MYKIGPSLIRTYVRRRCSVWETETCCVLKIRTKDLREKFACH